MAQKSVVIRGTPPGISLIKRLRGKDWSYNSYRYAVLLITFIAYTCYHASRKPSSIVKSVLHPEHDEEAVSNPWPIGNVFILKERLGNDEGGWKKKGWAPFNAEDGTLRLGEIDLAFLAFYAMGMYVAGHLGDRLDLRLFLTSGMIGSGIFVALFGMGYLWNIHAFSFFLVMQMTAGLFQATGWPSVVAVIGNWFGKRKRGLIMGIWNAHTSVGNISGSLLAASVLDYGWGWSFIVPGAFIFVGGILVYLFLAAYPEDVGYPCPHDLVVNQGTRPGDLEIPGQSIESQACDVRRVPSGNKRGIGLFEAFLIPGVVPFALCLFFSKLVAYTFLYWLPFYLTQTGTHSSLRGDSRALATVTAIIDGTGSVGAALGPLLTGFLSTGGWDRVFVMLMVCALIAGLLLSRLVIAEIADWVKKKQSANGQCFGGSASQPLLSNQR